MSNPTLSFSVSSQLDKFELKVEAEFNQLVTGIFGVSGAGKTTLFKCLAGLKKDVQGLICFNDIEWLNSNKKHFLAPEHRRIGYVPQNGLLFPNKNVRDNLTIAANRRTGRNANNKNRQNYGQAISFETVCELLELSSLLERSVVSLSGGERQRVALGRAICSDPDLLLLDEPLAALDFKLKRQILPFLYRIREELKIPMIMISHYPSEIQALCDDVLVIQQGKKIAFGPTQKILLNRDVLELTHGEYYENILPALVLQDQYNEKQEVVSSLLNIGVAAKEDATLVTENTKLKPGSKLMVGIPANDIIVAIYKPEGISAQNIIPAEVRAINQINGKYMIGTAVKNIASEINAEISAQSLERLNITIGDIVYLVIKSSACILYR